MNRKTTGIALAAIALAGAAQGQIDYNTASGPDDIEVESYVYTEWDGGFEFHTSFGTDFGYLDTEEFFKPTRTTIVDNFNLNAADYPSIDQLDSTVELTGETRSDFFEFSWDLAYRADFADSIDTSGASELFISTVRTYGPQGIRLRFDHPALGKDELSIDVCKAQGVECPTTPNANVSVAACEDVPLQMMVMAGQQLSVALSALDEASAPISFHAPSSGLNASALNWTNSTTSTPVCTG